VNQPTSTGATRGTEVIGQNSSHYRVTAALGAGGMAEVYRATDINLGRDVAIRCSPRKWRAIPSD